jgi:uncharacterized protein (DUF58 family)
MTPPPTYAGAKLVRLLDAAGYAERIEPTIARKTKRDYEQAVGLIAEVGALLPRIGRDDKLPKLIGEIRATHTRKRNLIALLDRMRLEPAA